MSSFDRVTIREDYIQSSDKAVELRRVADVSEILQLDDIPDAYGSFACAPYAASEWPISFPTVHLNMDGLLRKCGKGAEVQRWAWYRVWRPGKVSVRI